jgi:MFS family permease
VPVKELLKAQPRTLLLGMGTRFVEGFTYNLFSAYFLAYVVTNLELPKAWALDGIMVGAFLGVVLVVVSGAVSDRVGRKPVYRLGAWLALLFALVVGALRHPLPLLGAEHALPGVGHRRLGLHPARRRLMVSGRAARGTAAAWPTPASWLTCSSNACRPGECTGSSATPATASTPSWVRCAAPGAIPDWSRRGTRRTPR